uniref:Uncharacterized protein n=1 Tax=Stegastes partitus TaxID=144197 RepID=A0A3B5A7H9_9TELE
MVLFTLDQRSQQLESTRTTQEKLGGHEAKNRRSVSTMNLSKHADPVITKRLSSSSATLLHSPDRGNQQHTVSTGGLNKRDRILRRRENKLRVFCLC